MSRLEFRAKDRRACPRMLLMTVALCGALAGLAGCSPSEGAAVDTMVFIDTVTKRPVVQAASTESPAVNLTTGKRTLRPAAYCDACQAWHAIPPIDQLQRRPGALRCAKTRAALRFDGPRPAG